MNHRQIEGSRKVDHRQRKGTKRLDHRQTECFRRDDLEKEGVPNSFLLLRHRDNRQTEGFKSWLASRTKSYKGEGKEKKL